MMLPQIGTWDGRGPRPRAPGSQDSNLEQNEMEDDGDLGL